MREWSVLWLIGIFAGILAGVFGVGGGLVVVPALVLGLGYTQYAANGTSLVALLGPVGLMGVLAYYNSGQITGFHIRAGAIIAVGIFIGAYFGGRLALVLPEVTLRRSFCVFMLITAIKMWGKS